VCRCHLSWRRRIAFGGQANVIPSFCRMKASGERAAAPDPKHERQAPNLVLQTHPLANQLFERENSPAIDSALDTAVPSRNK
jgi:hypothetical protein